MDEEIVWIRSHYYQNVGTLILGSTNLFSVNNFRTQCYKARLQDRAVQESNGHLQAQIKQKLSAGKSLSAVLKHG